MRGTTCIVCLFGLTIYHVCLAGAVSGQWGAYWYRARNAHAL